MARRDLQPKRELLLTANDLSRAPQCLRVNARHSPLPEPSLSRPRKRIKPSGYSVSYWLAWRCTSFALGQRLSKHRPLCGGDLRREVQCFPSDLFQLFLEFFLRHQLWWLGACSSAVTIERSWPTSFALAGGLLWARLPTGADERTNTVAIEAANMETRRPDFSKR
jgi:hypothetical protein